MIRHGVFVQPGPPIIVARKRAVASCGCYVLVGLRTDTKEVAVSGSPCAPRHDHRMERFSLALSDSLVNPTNRPLIEVVDEILIATEEGF